MLLAGSDNASLPAPLIATLALTTLLPSIPILKQLDEWILGTFLDWGSIPAEVKRRAAAMMPESFSIAEADIAALRASYADGSYGDTLSTHLRASGTEGIELSQYRLTCVVKLYDRIKRLSTESRYSRFFDENSDEFTALGERLDAFLRQSDASLTVAVHLRQENARATYEAMFHEHREIFAQGCRAVFQELSLFLARGVLRSESTERDIVSRLRDAGFAAAEPMNEPEFPFNALTLLAVGILVYLAGLNIFFNQIMPSTNAQASPVLLFKIALVRTGTVALIVWLVQRFTFFRRAPGDPPKYFAYVLSGIIASVAAAVLCVPFALGSGDLETGMRNSTTLILLSGMLCTALALCCNDWPEDATAPRWLRGAEAAGCALVMMLGTVFTHFQGLLPSSFGDIQGWKLAAWIALPSSMALMFGWFVPHIYRCARRAATARRNDALHPTITARPEARQLVPPDAASGVPAHG
jgi:hypothetical protein